MSGFYLITQGEPFLGGEGVHLAMHLRKTGREGDQLGSSCNNMLSPRCLQNKPHFFPWSSGTGGSSHRIQGISFTHSFIHAIYTY